MRAVRRFRYRENLCVNQYSPRHGIGRTGNGSLPSFGKFVQINVFTGRSYNDTATTAASGAGAARHAACFGRHVAFNNMPRRRNSELFIWQNSIVTLSGALSGRYNILE